MTSDDCATGSDRVLAAVRLSGEKYDVLLSLQGDAPFTPPAAIAALLAAFSEDPRREVVTPVVPLRWSELDALRDAKRENAVQRHDRHRRGGRPRPVVQQDHTARPAR